MPSSKTVPSKLVVVVRKDLRLSPGKLAAQVAHAAVSLALLSEKRAPELFEPWIEGGQKKVVVKVETLDDLLHLKGIAERKGLLTVLVEDAGHTEVPPGTVTALGIGPGPEPLLDEVTGKLPLYS